MLSKTISTILLVTAPLSGISSVACVQALKFEGDALQVNNRNIEFNNIVAEDWLIVLGVIVGAIIALVISNRIVDKLMKRQVKYDWRNEYR